VLAKAAPKYLREISSLEKKDASKTTADGKRRLMELEESGEQAAEKMNEYTPSASRRQRLIESSDYQ
jgi:hypothetical protein